MHVVRQKSGHSMLFTSLPISVSQVGSKRSLRELFRVETVLGSSRQAKTHRAVMLQELWSQYQQNAPFRFGFQHTFLGTEMIDDVWNEINVVEKQIDDGVFNEK